MDDFAEALGLDHLQRETLLHHLGVEDAELVEAKKVGRCGSRGVGAFIFLMYISMGNLVA